MINYDRLKDLEYYWIYIPNRNRVELGLFSDNALGSGNPSFRPLDTHDWFALGSHPIMVLEHVYKPSYDPNFEEKENCLVKLDGSSVSFRCEVCGSNMFTHYQPLKYRCQGCGETYTGEL